MPTQDPGDLDRDPPTPVKQFLRREVGFGCPVPGCGNPYLQWHHFDPPWNQEHHHDPARMIALCGEHHYKAKAFTVEQCREWKATALSRNSPVAGKFDWMGHNVLFIAGGNYYTGTSILHQHYARPFIWFNRDEHNNLLLSIDIPDANGNSRACLLDNEWIIAGEPYDVESPPNGAYLKIRYRGGDRLEVQFREWRSEEKFAQRHERAQSLFPQDGYLTTAEIFLRSRGPGFDLHMTATKTVLRPSEGRGELTMSGNRHLDFSTEEEAAAFLERKQRPPTQDG